MGGHPLRRHPICRRNRPPKINQRNRFYSPHPRRPPNPPRSPIREGVKAIRPEQLPRIDAETDRKLVVIVQARRQILLIVKCARAENRIEAPPEKELRGGITPYVRGIVRDPVNPAGDQGHWRSTDFGGNAGATPLAASIART